MSFTFLDMAAHIDACPPFKRDLALGLHAEALGYGRGALDTEQGGCALSGEAIAFADAYLLRVLRFDGREAIYEAWRSWHSAGRTDR